MRIDLALAYLRYCLFLSGIGIYDHLHVVLKINANRIQDTTIICESVMIEIIYHQNRPRIGWRRRLCINRIISLSSICGIVFTCIEIPFFLRPYAVFINYSCFYCFLILLSGWPTDLSSFVAKGVLIGTAQEVPPGISGRRLVCNRQGKTGWHKIKCRE